MIFPLLIMYSDVALLLARAVAGAVFFSSGLSHVRNPEKRGAQMGIGTHAALGLGSAEVIASLMLALGAYAQIAAIVLGGIMLGAIFFKIFIWNTAFYAEQGYGWHYDLLLLSITAVIATLGPGAYALLS